MRAARQGLPLPCFPTLSLNGTTETLTIKRSNGCRQRWTRNSMHGDGDAKLRHTPKSETHGRVLIINTWPGPIGKFNLQVLASTPITLPQPGTYNPSPCSRSVTSSLPAFEVIPLRESLPVFP